MESKGLMDKKIAIIAADGFEESELLKPRQALLDAGAEVEILSLKSGTIKSWTKNNWGEAIKVDKTIVQASPEDYDGLLLPGGVINADKLRGDGATVHFVTNFLQTGKPVAAICHAAWTLVETGLLKGRTITSWPSLKTDLENAGAQWVDQEVVVDQGWVSSRKPDDIPAFNKKMLEEFQEGLHSPSRKIPKIDTSLSLRH